MERTRHTIHAEGEIAGRLASRIARLLQGKHKVSYQPYMDCGDWVRVLNAGKMKFSGKKLTKKLYHRFTGYPGGIKTVRLDELMARSPDRVLRQMVSAMLPKNKLRARMLKRLEFSTAKS